MILVVAQCKEDTLGLAVNKQAVLEPGLGKLALMGKKLGPWGYGSYLGAFNGKDGSSAGGLDKRVEQNKMAIPGTESHFQYHPLAAAHLNELQTPTEYNPAEQFFL